MSDVVNAGMLRAFIERIERVEEEIRTLNADKSEIYKELRGVGFDVKAVRQCVAARKLDSAEREERNAIFDLYWDALTCGPRVHVHEGWEVTTPNASNSKGCSVKIDDLVTTPHDPETGEITEHEQPETATKPGQDVQSPIQRALADENLDVTAGETAQEFPLQTSPETGSAGDPSPTSGQMDLVEAGTGQNCAVLPQEPCTAQITPSAATPAEPEAVSPTPPAASGTISPSSEFQGVTGGNPSEPSPDAGAEDVSAPAERKNAQSEQAAHHSDDDVPAFLKQELPRKTAADYRPHCQHPEACAASELQHCYSCSKMIAARESEVA